VADIDSDPNTPARQTPSAGLTLSLLALGHAVIHAQAALMPLIYPIIIIQFGLLERDIGLFIAITTAIGGLTQLTYGWLTRYVSRPILLGGGQLIFGASVLLSGLANSFGQLLGAISFARVGSSPQHPVGNALLSDAFPQARRGFAISAHISGGNVGTMLVPFIGGSLIPIVGWETTLALFGVPALAVGALIVWRVREDSRAYQAAAHRAGSVREQFRSVLGRGDLRLILGAALIAAGGRGLDIVAPFMVLYLRGELGIDEGTTQWLYALLLVGAVVGPLLAGWLSDRFGRRRILVSYYLLSALGILLFVAAGANLWLLAPLLLPFGTAVFSESPVLQAYIADRAIGPIRDVAFSVYFTFAFGIGAFWAFVIGNIVSSWGYVAAFSVMAASYVAAALLLLAIRDRATPPG
jgi:MFS family permease